MKLTILSPERRLLEGAAVDEVTLSGSEGQVQILAGHVPMMGLLVPGLFQYKTSEGHLSTGVISSGFFEVANEEVTVTAETLELSGEIDVERAKRAQREAEEVLRDANLDEHTFKDYQAKLEMALVRQQNAGKN